MRFAAVLVQFPALQAVELASWIEHRWVQPDPVEQDNDWSFREIDVARVRLIYELRADLAVADDSVPLVLSLIDQLHETRYSLRRVVEALADQPAVVREAVARALQDDAVE